MAVSPKRSAEPRTIGIDCDGEDSSKRQRIPGEDLGRAVRGQLVSRLTFESSAAEDAARDTLGSFPTAPSADQVSLVPVPSITATTTGIPLTDSIASVAASILPQPFPEQQAPPTSAIARAVSPQPSDATPLSRSDSPQSEQPPLSEREQIAQRRKAQILAAIAENAAEEPIFITPERRVCGVSGVDTPAIRSRKTPTTFIDDRYIRRTHSMRYLKSPFVSDYKIFDGTIATAAWNRWLINDDNEWHQGFPTFTKKLQAVAVTEGGRHVVLQMAGRACVSACVAMLVLDHGKIPNYEAVRITSLARDDHAIEWVEEAELQPYVTKYSNKDKNLIRDTLINCLDERGSGALDITDETIGAHEIVLDEISTRDNTATIRDPCHGWAITIDLDFFLSMIEDRFCFIQIDGEKTPPTPATDVGPSITDTTLPVSSVEERRSDGQA